MDYLSVPGCIFTHPQAAKVGLTEVEATAAGLNCTCRTLELSAIPKAKLINDTRGLIKMVAETETGRVLGVSILAPGGGDLIHEATLAVKFKLTVDDLIDTVHVFPTLSESIKLVAQSIDATSRNYLAALIRSDNVYSGILPAESGLAGLSHLDLRASSAGPARDNTAIGGPDNTPGKTVKSALRPSRN